MKPVTNYTAVRMVMMLEDLLDLMPLDDTEWETKKTLNIWLMRKAIQQFRDDLKEELFGQR